MLGASGHIAGVVNPAAEEQAQLLDVEATPYPDDAEALAAQAQRGSRGSWWPALERSGSARHKGGEREAPRADRQRAISSDRSRRPDAM